MGLIQLLHESEGRVTLRETDYFTQKYSDLIYSFIAEKKQCQGRCRHKADCILLTSLSSDQTTI